MVELSPVMLLITFTLGIAIYNCCKSILLGKGVWVEITISIFLLAVMIIINKMEGYYG